MGDSSLILVVEDQPHLLLTLKFLLESLPHLEVVTASDGQAAVELAIGRRPDLILMDVMLPRIDGYSAVRQIRKAWDGHPGRIWFLTGRGTQIDRAQAEEVGGERVITKPFDPDELMNLIRTTLNLDRRSSAAA